MPEEKAVPGWRKRFLANRMTFESILFEKELLVPGKENFKVGLAAALAMALCAALLPAQWVLRQGYFFSAADAAGFRTVFAWLEHFGTDGVWSLFKPLPDAFGAPPVPPLYYLTYVPVLKYITGSLNWALILVNTFYISGLTLAVFTAIRKNRGNKPGWLGAGFALAMPFVLETARHPDHRLTAMALAAAVYACYINSEEFQYPAWNLWSAVLGGQIRATRFLRRYHVLGLYAAARAFPAERPDQQPGVGFHPEGACAVGGPGSALVRFRGRSLDL